MFYRPAPLQREAGKVFRRVCLIAKFGVWGKGKWELGTPAARQPTATRIADELARIGEGGKMSTRSRIASTEYPLNITI